MSLSTSSEGGANGLGNDVHQTPTIAGGDELQDGDNSRELEPGELVTPPHQQQGNASPSLKKMLAKDVMNKALRKRTQIDTDNGEEHVSAILELEAIKRKDQATKTTTQAQVYENGNVATPPAALDADDSEGLYSDTDSSTDEHKNVEDVQQARKEKQAEAAAAAAATPQPPPAPHHRFLGLNPLRFHMRPPRFDYNRIGFMPRMPRGGMRGMRPQFFSRPPTPNRNGNRGATPPTLTQAAAQGKESMSPGAYGPVLPPGQPQSQRQGAKRLQSELNWTTIDPAVSYSFNVVLECENDQHKCCKTKKNQLISHTPNETARRSHRDSRESTQNKYSRELPDMHKEKPSEDSSHKSRARSHDKKTDSSKERLRNKQEERCSDRKRDQSNEKHKTRSKEQGNSNSDEQWERSKEPKRRRSKDRTEYDRDKPAKHARERSTQRQTHSKREPEVARDKPAERSTDKSRELSNDRQSKKSEQHRRSRSKSRKAKTPPLPQVNHVDVQAEELKLQLTPPTGPLSEPTLAEMRKSFDIFAESPPRLNKESSLTKPQVANPAKITAELKTITTPERSTTPPLGDRHKTALPKVEPSKVTAPLLKIHSEIHSRIGALLEDNDLHLDALLATKEQLLRKSHEHRHKKQAPRELHIKKEPIEQDATINSHPATSTRHANPFKRETVLPDMLTNLTQSPRGSVQRYRDRDVKPLRRSDEYRERSIKLEKNRSRTPPLLTAQQIKLERNATPPPRALRAESDREKEVPVRNGIYAANAPPPTANEHSPDTDDYIDNWENDDSMAGGDSNAPSALAARLNGEDDDSNALWNANSTPPPKSKLPQTPATTTTATAAAAATVPQNTLFNIHDLYDKFMKSIKMSGNSHESSKATAAEAQPNSSLSNSTAGESSSETDATSSSSSSSSANSSSSDANDDDDEDDDDDDDDSSTDEENNVDLAQQQQQLEASSDQSVSQFQAAAIDAESESSTGKQFPNHKKNNVSKDLRKLKSLEDNLARIQMMRENYDSGDDICEELLKMESLFLMQRNAIMNKYRKSELKPSTEEELSAEQQAQQLKQEPLQPASPVNNIFNANREAIKLTISPLKLSLKPTIFDKDEPEVQPQTPPLDEKLKKPPKEVAIVKPTIMDTRSKPLSSSTSTRAQPQHQLKRSRTRERSRSRSLSRNRFRRNVRPSHGKDLTRSPSPRRRRVMHSPRRGRFGKPRLAMMTHNSRSRSISRSRTRSRSPLRRRRIKPVGARRRSSLSPLPPPPGKLLGPRSPPPPMRRRSYSRERCYSRSPLPFKPPSPPMRRSWSSSRSRSPTRRRSRSRSRSPHAQNYDDFFVENQSLEAAAYYYNMSLMQQNASGEQYDSYAAYMDSAYNMEQAYSQYGDYSMITTPASMDYGYVTDALPGTPLETPSVPVLRELAMAPNAMPPISMPSSAMPSVAMGPVAVQKGNVLEIVPSMGSTGELATPVLPEVALEDKSKPKRKRVNFVDNVLPNYESDSEDRKIVQKAVDRALRQYRERCNAKAAKLQRTREQLLSVLAPPPPLTPKPPHLEKALLVQKKPKFRYYHFDPVKGAIVKTRTRLNRPPLGHGPPRFDPKYMAMLVKSGRLPMPAFMRHRPPPPPAQADAMLQEFFSKHPPPPLHHVMPHYMRGPPPMATSVGPQPIPVLGGSSYSSYMPNPAPVVTPVPSVVPVQPALVPLPVPVLTAPSPATSTPPPSMVAPFFTPPPLPTLSSHFSVQPVPTMREIIPMDILQKIGPLPKTLDLDVGNAGLDEANNDLNEARTASPVKQAADLSTPPPQLVET